MKKVVLAFSGGLDTSFCAVYLQQDLGYEVHAVTVNTGGFNAEEVKKLEQKAILLGAKTFTSLDVVKEYYDSCIQYLVFGNVLKNNTYPLSVSAERTIQAKSLAEYALKIGATAIAHGSTGAGNDQVRFDGIFNIVCPQMEIITPIRDLKLSREAEIQYLTDKGFSGDYTKSVYSINQGLWGTSVGGKETLTSHSNLPEEAYPSQLKKQNPEKLTLEFEKGHLIKINDKAFSHPSKAIVELNEIASEFAIGRDTHVGDTIIGIKGRVGFEAAGAILTLKAHHLLEKHVLSKYQLMIKSQMADWYGTWLHEALFLDPVMRDIEKLMENSQKNVTGKVFVTLLPYRFELNGIESKYDLMTSKFGSYGEMNKSWSGEDVKGFSKIYTNYLSIYHQVNAENND